MLMWFQFKGAIPNDQYQIKIYEVNSSFASMNKMVSILLILTVKTPVFSFLHVRTKDVVNIFHLILYGR